MLASAVPLQLVCGCGASAQVVAGGGLKELDLSRLIVWHTQDCSVVTSRSKGQYKTVQTFYDRSGRRLDELDLGYLFSWRTQICFSEGLAVATLDDETRLSGYVDRAGRVVIPFQFYYAFPFTDGRAVVAVNESNEYENRREGLIDRQGRWIVSAGRYEDLKPGSEGRWPFRIRTRQEDGKRWGFLDAKGTVVVEPRYRWVCAYREGLGLVDDGDNLALENRDSHLFALRK